MPARSGCPVGPGSLLGQVAARPVSIHAGHLVREAEDGLEVLDTGSPITIPAPAELRQALPIDVVRLVGMDELGQEPFLLDWDRALFTPGAPEPSDAAWTTLTIRLGVPCTEIRVVSGPAPTTAAAILDTGAPISYAPASAVAGMMPVGSAKDFYPMLGEFVTELYDLEIECLGHAQPIRVGVFPPILAMALSMLAADAWILGADFFSGLPAVGAFEDALVALEHGGGRVAVTFLGEDGETTLLCLAGDGGGGELPALDLGGGGPGVVGRVGKFLGGGFDVVLGVGKFAAQADRGSGREWRGDCAIHARGLDRAGKGKISARHPRRATDEPCGRDDRRT